MAAVDRLRRAANAGIKAAARLSLHNTAVALRVEVYDRPRGSSGAVLSSAVETTVSPTPRVMPAADGDPSWFGSAGKGDTGLLTARSYILGPIAKPYPGGGLDPTPFVTASTTMRRVLVRLSGDDFSPGGELFLVRAVSSDFAGPLTFRLLVVRAQQ